MSFTDFTNLTSAYGLIFYNGYIYAGSYSNATITKIKFNDSTDYSTYYTFSSNYFLTSM